MIGFPFDSIVSFDEHGYPIFDRAVSSKPLKSLIAKLFSTGVMPNPSNNLQVFAGEEGMTVTVKAGFCVIEGGLKLEDTDRTLEIQAADTTYDRIDTVVMRWNGNDNARVCDLYVLEGTPAASPVRPELTREGSIYEIGLADIFIPRNTSVIAQQRITDTRLDTDRCGIVSSVSEFDTSTLYAQIQADLDEFKDVEEADFIEWYNAIKDRIDSITAETLQAQIDELHDEIHEETETKTGNPINFTTDSEQISNNTVVNFVVTQSESGDPSPSNPRPFVGFDFISISSQNNLKTIATMEQGYLLSNGTKDDTDSSAVRLNSFIPIKKGCAIRASVDSEISGTHIAIYFWENDTYGTNNNFAWKIDSLHNSVSAIAPRDCYVTIGVDVYYPRTISPSDVEVSIYGFNDYIQYLDSTIYGGTWDVEKGLLTLTHKGVDMGSLTWSYGSGSGTMYADPVDRKNGPTNLLCEIYKTASSASTDKTITGQSNSYRIYVKDTDYGSSDVNAFKTAVTGHYIVYELATPIVIHLTPNVVELLNGENIVTSNGTSISLTYRKGDIAKLSDLVELGESINALSDIVEQKAERNDISNIQLIGNTNTTGATIALGTIFYLNGVLVRARADIAAGATFTLNTNYYVYNLSPTVEATRASVEKISSTTSFDIQANSSATFTLSTSSSFMIAISGRSTNVGSLFTTFTSGANSTYLNTLFKGSEISASATSNTITISSTSSYVIHVIFIGFNNTNTNNNTVVTVNS